MADAYSYTLNIVLPDVDARAIVAMTTGADPGPNGLDTEALARDQVGAVASAAVRDLIRRSADFRPMGASIVVSVPETPLNPEFPVTNGDTV